MKGAHIMQFPQHTKGISNCVFQSARKPWHKPSLDDICHLTSSHERKYPVQRANWCNQYAERFWATQWGIGRLDVITSWLRVYFTQWTLSSHWMAQKSFRNSTSSLCSATSTTLCTPLCTRRSITDELSSAELSPRWLHSLFPLSPQSIPLHDSADYGFAGPTHTPGLAPLTLPLQAQIQRHRKLQTSWVAFFIQIANYTFVPWAVAKKRAKNILLITRLFSFSCSRK